MASRQIRTFDMYCGGGGSSRGAAMFGATLVGALDKWSLAIDAYKLNFPNALTYQMLASSLSPHRVLEEVGPIDLLLASPECTSHSVAKGSKPGSEESRATAFDVVRFAKVLQPRWIVVENVIQMQRWHRFEEWRRKLTQIGYNITLGVIDSQYHSTPQARRRLFIIADLEHRPELPISDGIARRTVNDILGTGERKSAPWQFSPIDVRTRAAATIDRVRGAVQSIGKRKDFILVYYGSDGAGGYQTLDRPLRTITTLDRFAYVKFSGRGYKMRMLQPPELAAAMGFPRYHQWPKVSRRDQIKLIGNAVCPRVMRDVLRSLILTR